MGLVEEVRHCAACGERTAHSRRVVAVPVVVAVLLLGVGGVGVAEGYAAEDAEILLAASAAVLGGLLLWAWDRTRYVRIACGRCRWRRVQAERGSRWPRLDGHSTIDGI